MNLLFKNVSVIDEGAPRRLRKADVAVADKTIAAVGKAPEDFSADRVIDGEKLLLLPGFYNAHCHSAMTLFRGYAEDMPLQKWLNERIFPTEAKLTHEAVYAGSLLACAEMIKNGVVSFTDMYDKCEDTLRAVAETGMKCNTSRAVMSFDGGDNIAGDFRTKEAIALAEEYNGACDGRIRVDMSLHAEYTNNAKSAEYIAKYAAEHGLRLHIHLSETETEHRECIARHGCTPLRFFERAGALEVPVTAAHCVYVTDDDIALMAEKGVTAVHNPSSNLKLGSGVMPLRKMLDAGVNVALGTDGASSNNALDLLFELRLAAILHKGIARRADETTAAELLPLLAENGARSQGRDDCGRLEAGTRADLVAINIDTPNASPLWDGPSLVCYAISSADVALTMADGRILYENGEYKTLDLERAIYGANKVCGEIYGLTGGSNERK